MAFRAGHVFGTFEKRATVLTFHHSHVYTKFAKAYLLSVNTLPLFSSSPEKTATTQTSIQTGKNKGTKFYLQCTKKSNPIFYKNKMSSSGKFVALVCLVVWNPLSKLVSVGYYEHAHLKGDQERENSEQRSNFRVYFVAFQFSAHVLELEIDNILFSHTESCIWSNNTFLSPKLELRPSLSR